MDTLFKNLNSFKLLCIFLSFYLFHTQLTNSSEPQIIYKFFCNSSYSPYSPNVLNDSSFEFSSYNDLIQSIGDIFGQLSNNCSIQNHDEIIFQIIFNQELNVLENGDGVNSISNSLNCFDSVNLEIVGEIFQYPTLILADNFDLSNFNHTLVKNLQITLIRSAYWDYLFLTWTFNGNLTFYNVKITTSEQYYFDDNGDFTLNLTNVSDSGFCHIFNIVIGASVVKFDQIFVEVVIVTDYFSSHSNLIEIDSVSSLNITNIQVENSLFQQLESLFLFSLTNSENIACILQNFSILNTDISGYKLVTNNYFYGLLTFEESTSTLFCSITFDNLSLVSLNLDNSYLFLFQFPSIDPTYYQLTFININITNSNFLQSNFLDIQTNFSLVVKNVKVAKSYFANSSIIYVNSQTEFDQMYLISNFFDFSFSISSEVFLILIDLYNQILNNCSVILENNSIITTSQSVTFLKLDETQGNVSFQNLNFTFIFTSNLTIFNFSNQITNLTFINANFQDLTQSFNKCFLILNQTNLLGFYVESSNFLGFVYDNPLLFIQNLNPMKVFLSSVNFYTTIVKSAQNSALLFINDSNSSYDVVISFCTFSDSIFDNELGVGSLVFMNSILSTLSLNSSNFNNISFFGNYKSMFSLDIEKLIISNCSFSNFYSKIDGIFSRCSVFDLQISNFFANYSTFQNLNSTEGTIFYINAWNRSQMNIDIENCSFKGIYAINGAVFYFNKSQTNSVTSFMTSCIFNLSFAAQSGGVFYLQYIARFDVIDSIFINCYAGQGGLLYSLSSYFNVSNSAVTCAEMNENLLENVVFLNLGPLVFAESSSKVYFNTCSIFNVLPTLSDVNLFKLMISELDFWNGSIINNDFINGSITLIYSTARFGSSIFESNREFISNTTNSLGPYQSFIYLIWSIISFSSCTVSRTSCLQCLVGGAFLTSEYGFINLVQSVFQYNIGYTGSVLHLTENAKFLEFDESSVTNCIFQHNSAIADGGSLYIMETSLQLFNNTFLNNTSINGKGGALYFYGLPNLNPEPYVFYCNFTQNKAVVGGAIYYQINYLYLNQSSNYFSQNNASAGFGINIFSNPRSLKFSAIQSIKNYTFVKKNTTVLNFRSGGVLTNLLVSLLSEENETILNCDILPAPILTIEFPDNSQKYIINLDNSGYFNISSFSIESAPKTILALQFSSDSINFPVELESNTYQYSLNLSIHFRECNKVGELYYKTTDQSCFQCLVPTYSYNPNNLVCKQCPEGGDCSKVGVFRIEPRYWRNSLYDEAPNILYCLNNPNNCVGGGGFGNDLCFLGHIGPRCESCDALGIKWGKSYSRNNGFSCVDCSKTNFSWLFAFFGVVFYCLFIILTLKVSLDNYALIKEGNSKRINLDAQNKENLHSYILKILISYFQIIAVINDFSLFSSSAFNEVYLAVSSPITSSLYSFDCIIASFFSKSKLPLIYYRLILSWIIPIICAFFVSLAVFLFKRKWKFNIKRKFLPTIFLFTFIYFQKELVKQSIDSLACIKIGVNSYIKADVFYQCDQNYSFYSKIFGIPSLLVFGLLIPIIIFLKIYKNKPRHSELSFQAKYGYIYSEYRIYYWEFIKMGEKILIVVIQEYYDSDNRIKGMLAFICIFIYFFILIKVQPYEKAKINFLEEICSITCMFSIFLCLLIIDDEINYITVICYVALIGINAIFLCYTVSLFWKSFKEKGKQTILIIIKYIFGKKQKQKYEETQKNENLHDKINTVPQIPNQVEIFKNLEPLEKMNIELNYLNNKNEKMDIVPQNGPNKVDILEALDHLEEISSEKNNIEFKNLNVGQISQENNKLSMIE